MQPRFSRRAGFSMIEIVAAVGILVLLAGVLIPAVGSQMQKSRVARAKTDMTTVAQAFNSYFVDTGVWPSNATFVQSANVQDDFVGFPCFYNNSHAHSGWSGPYLSNGVRISNTVMNVATADPAQGGLRDPWGNVFRVIYVAKTTSNPGALFLFSGGPNGVINTSNTNLARGIATSDDIAVIVTRSY
ncbi:MAG: hypothetical protein GC161_02205 [Planctomycetaceae bacterium]|nr:hypothetical protein [Planctomycetaceae bacterium]